MSDGSDADMRGRRAQARREALTYLLGFVAALVLTVTAFAVVYRPRLLGHQTLGAIFALGLIQAIVHFRYFLHVKLTRSSRDDLLLLSFTSVIIALMVAGTLVMLANLRMRMM
jgi:cytochrome o ubiquinol oxidase operon protein cyoD